MKKIVVIAAAGKGNRLGAGVPKCLVKVNGRYVFEYLLEAFSWADEIRMVVGYKAEEVISCVLKIYPNVIFVPNEAYDSTTTLQSNCVGAKDLEGNVLFVDGDMILSKQTAKDLYKKYEDNEEFVGVATDISETPVYTGVEQENVEWFSYEKKSGFEWANVALFSAKKLEYNHTHFFVQIQKFLPMKAVKIERLEIDTPVDLEHAEKVLTQANENYDFWEDEQ